MSVEQTGPARYPDCVGAIQIAQTAWEFLPTGKVACVEAASLPDLLARHTLVDTVRPDEARQEIGRIFCPHFLSPGARHGEGFHAVHRSVRQGFYSLNLVGYGCEVEIDPGELSNFFLLQIPIAGSAEVRCGTETVQVRPGQSASLLSPTLATRMRWSDGCAKLIVLLERRAMEDRWEALAARRSGPVEFAIKIDTIGPVGGLLMNHVRLMAESAEAPGIPEPYRARLGDDLAMLLLMSLAHSQSALMDRSPPAGSHAVARAQDWIRANMDRSFSVAEVAQAAGISLRSLQDGIRRQKGVTLTKLIETIRLEAFRSALTDPRGQASVTDAALVAGLGHLGRAAIAYRKQYGEAPSETLRRRDPSASTTGKSG